jgi:DNA (cytosine-5)-methyltransferase 1
MSPPKAAEMPANQPNGKAPVFNHLPRQAGPEVLNRVRHLKIGQKMQDLPESLWHESFRYYMKEDPSRQGGPNLRLIRLDPDKPSLTVTGYVFNKFVHPTEDRFITPREAARLQGFPDEFEFMGPLTSVQRQVGNAVPVPLARAVAQAALDHATKNRPCGLGDSIYRGKPFPAVSLFSGAGGMDLGAGQARAGAARWQIIRCVEQDARSCETLRRNFGRETVVVESDIRKVQPESGLDLAGLENGVLPLLIGGPPCQAFSQAGKQKGAKDPRGQMIFEFLRFVEALHPLYFIMENVSGLRGIDNGRMLRRIVRRMEEAGYSVGFGLLCAADYGAAQLRRRFFFTGVREARGKVPLPRPTHGVAEIGSGLEPRAGVAQAFAGLPSLAPK